MRRSLISAFLGWAAFIALASYVWLTPYRYDHVKIGNDNLPLRINRLNGKTEFFTTRGWRSSDNESQARSHDLSSTEIAKIMGQANITSYGYVEFDAYNGTDQVITGITITITVSDAQKNQVLSRAYRLWPKDGILLNPQSTAIFTAALGFNLEPAQTWQFYVSGAKGRTEVQR